MSARRFAMLMVEGPTDQAVVGRALKLRGFKRFEGDLRKQPLDSYWKDEVGVIPKYPPASGRLYERIEMPSILDNDDWSIAIYCGGGSKLSSRLSTLMTLIEARGLQHSLNAIGIIADADNKGPESVAQFYQRELRAMFPLFPPAAGEVVEGPPRAGIFVSPDNHQNGVIEHLILECGEQVYPAILGHAREFVRAFDPQERRQAGWKPYDEQKAIIASIVSLLKPGKTNTASLSDNKWIGAETQSTPMLSALLGFLDRLFPPR